ncbi:hypothetical protein L9F63_005165, partial [Diploptera punctata]
AHHIAELATREHQLQQQQPRKALYSSVTTRTKIPIINLLFTDRDFLTATGVSSSSNSHTLFWAFVWMRSPIIKPFQNHSPFAISALLFLTSMFLLTTDLADRLLWNMV